MDEVAPPVPARLQQVATWNSNDMANLGRMLLGSREVDPAMPPMARLAVLAVSVTAIALDLLREQERRRNRCASSSGSPPISMLRWTSEHMGGC